MKDLLRRTIELLLQGVQQPGVLSPENVHYEQFSALQLLPT